MEQAGKAPAVLIVEDEALIRMGAVRMIEDAGFEVIEAANADEAIQILESRSGIRVVFTDIHMPGSMDGLKLAHAVRDRWPPIKIIVTSGRELLTERDLPEGDPLADQFQREPRGRLGGDRTLPGAARARRLAFFRPTRSSFLGTFRAEPSCGWRRSNSFHTKSGSMSAEIHKTTRL